MARAPKSVEVRLDLKLISISGVWEPNNAERRAAWELYVELITRAAVVPLEHGMLREALDSVYGLFSTTRDVLKRYGPDLAEPKAKGDYNLAYLLVAMLNCAVRPLLSYWHPELEAWEAQRPVGGSGLEHERAWVHAGELRDALGKSSTILKEYTLLLARVCGVGDISSLGPAPGIGRSESSIG